MNHLSPTHQNSVLILGRVFGASDSDLSTAYDLAKQMHLSPWDESNSESDPLE